ncbi:peptide chain release factor N(5)-glutamine methyltransferase [Candidatus Peregrinibacteria bacterium]|jgi:release factor glutamine methyltransferase|nr:peptide chain release factor N(5)-glutamine methyltransferase [Candidatus Peregrinibacteria bacterium]MBT7702865.1 peptide chain release factor N(5)-glutamine methyltransferase [Candidatus Peregrinibacteria bacterium]
MTSVKDFINRARILDKRLEAELILAAVLKVSKEQIFAYPERDLEPNEIEKVTDFWKRVEDGEPMAYILGKKEFHGIELKTDKRALIPRPETEFLVEKTMDLIEGIKNPRILDVGTGCGAIALALAKAVPNANVFGSDVSEEAIQLSRENATGLDLVSQVEFWVSDLLKSVPEDLKIDVLVANLPYIGEEKFHFVEKNVKKYEPHVALFGGHDGLRLYEQLFEQINSSILGIKWVLGEFGSMQTEILEQMLDHYFSDKKWEILPDLAGLDRYFIIYL